MVAIEGRSSVRPRSPCRSPGRTVLLIDADRQASAQKALTMRAENGRLPLACVGLAEGRLPRTQLGPRRPARRHHHRRRGARQRSAADRYATFRARSPPPSCSRDLPRQRLVRSRSDRKPEPRILGLPRRTFGAVRSAVQAGTATGSSWQTVASSRTARHKPASSQCRRLAESVDGKHPAYHCRHSHVTRWTTGTGENRRDGRREEKSEVVTPTERNELIRLRRENKQLRQERDILSRAAAWFARETGAVPSGSSNSCARIRRNFRSRRWRACSACRSPAITPGGDERHRPVRLKTRCC